MARGLILSSQLILSSIARPLPPTKFPKYPSSSSPSFSFSSAHLKNFTVCTRFLCSCSSQQQHDPIDMENYEETFARRMTMAGLKPHHRIALGVSGGPDSMALCVLAAAWKTQGCNVPINDGSEFIDGLLAIVVDHGLRAESKYEANLVSHRVVDMGIRCEIARCEWFNGKPKQGHLQEAARDKRYEIFRSVCIRHKIGVLLIAHHADDQAELFILRLSRGSGVLGLAGMAFSSQLFAKCRDLNCEAPSAHGILLVRPLLEFSKEDMYQICRGANREWVEDPTNRNASFARNRIRMSLNNLSSSIYKAELLALVSACRRTRLHVDRFCSHLMHRAVTVMPEGYAVIDVRILNPSEIGDLILSKFVSLVLQFISQRQRPVRGSVLKLVLDYIRASPCKTCLTAAGCYLCPAPGSKGTKILVCCAVNSSLPLKMELFEAGSDRQSCSIGEEVEQIVADGKSYSDKFVPDALDVHFLDTISSESLLTCAKRQNILSEATCGEIASLQKGESENFKLKTENMSNCEIKDEVECANTTLSKILYPGQIGYFMDRYLVTWNLSKRVTYDLSSVKTTDYKQDPRVERQFCCSGCIVSHDTAAKVRPMIDTDWLYLAQLAKHHNVGNSLMFPPPLGTEKITSSSCMDYVKLSAEKALVSLKSIPVGARRGLPVLVNSHGLLLSIPSVSFVHCPCLMVSARFKPSTPLGGGHSSFI